MTTFSSVGNRQSEIMKEIDVTLCEPAPSIIVAILVDSLYLWLLAMNIGGLRVSAQKAGGANRMEFVWLTAPVARRLISLIE